MPFYLFLRRLRRSPAAFCGLIAIALLVLYGIWRDSDLFFEAALLIAVLGFVGTVAVAKYMLRGDIIE